MRAGAARVDQLEIQILELRRKKDLDEANYKYYAASLEQSRINEALGNGSVSNISVIEAPTPPARDSKKSLQILGGIVGGGEAVRHRHSSTAVTPTSVILAWSARVPVAAVRVEVITPATIKPLLVDSGFMSADELPACKARLAQVP